jgi:hypothetical protein
MKWNFLWSKYFRKKFHSLVNDLLHVKYVLCHLTLRTKETDSRYGG